MESLTFFWLGRYNNLLGFKVLTLAKKLIDSYKNIILLDDIYGSHTNLF